MRHLDTRAFLSATLTAAAFALSGCAGTCDEGVDISFSTDFADDEVDVGNDERDLSNASVTITDDGSGIRMTLDSGFPGASGFIQCEGS